MIEAPYSPDFEDDDSFAEDAAERRAEEAAAEAEAGAWGEGLR